VNEWELGAWQKSGGTYIRIFNTGVSVVLSMASIQTLLGRERSVDSEWVSESTSINRIGVAALITPVVIRNEGSRKRFGGLVDGEAIRTAADLGSIT